MMKNDIIWFFDLYNNLCHGTILEIGQDFILVKENYDSHWMPSEECFPSKEACCKAREEQREKQIAEYEKSIKTVSDLIGFMYTYVVCPAEEYTDWEARAAVERKAMEFGINLSDND